MTLIIASRMSHVSASVHRAIIGPRTVVHVKVSRRLRITYMNVLIHIGSAKIILSLVLNASSGVVFIIRALPAICSRPQ